MAVLLPLLAFSAQGAKVASDLWLVTLSLSPFLFLSLSLSPYAFSSPHPYHIPWMMTVQVRWIHLDAEQQEVEYAFNPIVYAGIIVILAALAMGRMVHLFHSVLRASGVPYRPVLHSLFFYQIGSS